MNEQNFGSGLATRLTCIPLPSTNFEMMERERTVDFESDGRLKEWAFKLDRMKGILSLDKIVDELYDWTARRMMDAKEEQLQGRRDAAEAMCLSRAELRCSVHCDASLATRFIRKVLLNIGEVRDRRCGLATHLELLE